MFSLLDVSVSLTNLLDLLVVFPSSVSNMTALETKYQIEFVCNKFSPVVVLVIIKRTGTMIPSSLQCCKIWKIKTTSSLAKKINFNMDSEFCNSFNY